MTPPPALSVMRNRAAVAEELRCLLPRIEGLRSAKPIPFGLPILDRCLPQGGLAGGALHEVVPEAGGMPAAFGFVGALLARISSSPPGEGGRTPDRARPLVLVLPGYGRYGRLYGHGLNALGLDPGRLILVETARRRDTLWALEEALRSRAPAAVAGAIDRLDLKSSQRLQLAATDAGLPLFLLRPAEPAASPSSSPASGRGWGEASAAATRWRIGTVAAARDRYGLIVRPRWHLQLERCRNGRPGEWLVEYDHVAHCFSLAAALADRSLSGNAGSARGGQADRS